MKRVSERRESTYNHVVMPGQDVLGFARVVVPDADRVVFAAGRESLTVLTGLNASDAHGVSAELVNLNLLVKVHLVLGNVSELVTH